ncbi:hypothetical protein [Tepidibacter sp. Z1-5]|uniref:hypothetical protein n=1 Tax=Tepidibacter sp. Z1-5 TaxID=3134138 RepID=UPI0030ECF03D
MLQIYLNLKIFIVNFSKKKNQSGYQLSAALAGKNAETVAMYLDSGNVHCSHRFKDLLKSSLENYRHIRLCSSR